MKIAAPLLLIYLTFSQLAQTPTGPVSPRTFELVERIGEANERAFFVLSAGDLTYTIRHDGLGDTTSTRFLRKNRVFRLQLGGEGRLSRLFKNEFNGDSILMYEVSQGNSGRSYIARLDQNTRAFHWVTHIPIVYVGFGVTEDKFAYFGGSNYLAKVDLESGEYLWQVTNFGDQPGPKSREFKVMKLSSDRVILSERGQAASVIEIDKLTGNVLSITTNPTR